MQLKIMSWRKVSASVDPPKDQVYLRMPLSRANLEITTIILGTYTPSDFVERKANKTETKWQKVVT